MSPAAVMHSLAVLAGTIGLGIGTFLYSIQRTLLLRHFLVFLTSLFLFVLSFFLRETGVPEPESAAILAFIAEASAGILQVTILPYLVFGLFMQPVPFPARAVSATSALLLAMLTLASAFAPQVLATRIALAAVLYGSVAAYIIRMIVWLRRSHREEQPAEQAEVRRALRGFVVLSAVFFPLFVLDVLFTFAQPVGVVLALDDLSVPLYFIVLSVGAIRFARRYLNRPALIEDEELTSHGREIFSLTAREAEVVEYIMEGFTVPDAAKALRISAKTVENHLYHVYQKTGVSNRIQLFQLFKNRRRV